MSIHIKSRKHGAAGLPLNLRTSLGISIAASTLALAAPFNVSAQQNDGNLPPVEIKERNESYKAERVSSPKFTQPLVDTTQTITVIKKELMQSQQATTLTEALQNSAGVGTFNTGENGATSTGDAIFMRGFNTANSIFVDNIRDAGSVSRDLFNIEQVEVVKGPAGADNGRGAPTGYINMVTKQPTLENAYSGSATYGTGNNKRLTADFNRQIDGLNGSAFRLNLMTQDSGVPGRDRVNNKRWAIAPSFAIGLGTPTRLLFDYLHVDRNNVPDAGLPTIGTPGFYNASTVGKNGAAVARSNYYGTANDYDKSTSDMFTAIFEHDLSAGMTIRNIMRYGKTKQDYRIGSPFVIDGSASNPANWTVSRLAQTLDRGNEIFTNQTNAVIKFNTGAIKHAVTTGVEFIREKQTAVLYAGTLAAANLYAPDAYAPASLSVRPSGARNEGTTNTIGAYLFDTLELSPQFQVNGGVRLDRYNTDYNGITLSTADSAPGLPVGTLVPVTLGKGGTLLNWKIGALYKPASNGSIYAAYATSQQPPGGAAFALSTTGSSADNPNFAPQKTGTTEVGTKWEVFNKKLLVSAVLFRTEVSNEITQDAVTSNLYVQNGKKRVDGLELSASGEITSSWSVNASAALMNAKVSSGTSNASATSNQNNAAMSFSPKKTMTLWSTYLLPSGFTIGGGIRYVDTIARTASTTISGTTNTPYAQSYWIADAMAAYQLSKNVNVQLNLYNLTNERYVASLNNSGARYIPGAERSARLSLNLAY
ncbi:catecholate siderophore receptor Fiu [Herbaspirillum rhizosphaerae]|uniref:catecholate siderophore receptor Fiu n=1 Tax=Herbaspirillum rhizosphaerae TaxID=346179 RepID=UPI00067C1BE1|nr:catecholate siderophore receptor Fiu [Herbaspirillum rhizosphaerae]